MHGSTEFGQASTSCHIFEKSLTIFSFFSPGPRALGGPPGGRGCRPDICSAARRQGSHAGGRPRGAAPSPPPRAAACARYRENREQKRGRTAAHRCPRETTSALKQPQQARWPPPRLARLRRRLKLRLRRGLEAVAALSRPTALCPGEGSLSALYVGVFSPLCVQNALAFDPETWD